jgi:hypothetical protein
LKPIIRLLAKNSKRSLRCPPLVHFNDTCCCSVAELRSVILKARRLADDHAEQQRAAAAVKTWLLERIEKKRPAPSADIADTAPDEPFAPPATERPGTASD